MADKKISELPLLNSVSGSSIIVPIVHDGTTTKVNLSQIAHYSSQWSAKTGSANTFTGNQTINGNLSVSGRLTVHEVVAQYETASILFSTGSTKLGDQLTDVHEFTGSTNITGALYYNNVLVTNIDANTVFKLQQTTASLNTQTGSQDLVNFGISSVTGAINTTTSSFDSVFQRISSTTGSINTTTSSFDSVFLGISSVTGAMNTTTSSFDSVFQRISSTTGSINTTTSSFDSVFLGISSVTGAMNTQSSSQDLVNRQISSTTGSINTTTSSFDLVFRGISSVTGAMNTQSSSQDLVNRQVSLVTGSIHFVTGAFNAFTGSVIGQTNTISTFTSSVNFATQSLNTQTGSQDLVNRGISSVTGSINTTTSSFNSVFSQIGSTTSSLIGITNGLMAFTAALDSTYATDAQLYQLYQATASIHSTTASLNIQTGSQDLVNRGISSVTGAMNTQSSSQDLVNLGISSVTGSLIGITNGLMVLTASMKAQAIVSSSTQISNYYKFAETASASTTFYGNVIGASNIQANKFVFTDAVINTNVGGQKIVATSGNILYLYSGTSGLYINNQANDTTIAQFTNAGQLTIGGPGNDQNLVFGGTNSSIYWGSGGPARMYYNVGDIKISSAGATDVLNVKNIGGIEVNGGITGSLMATNGVISGSVQLPEIAGIEAYTASLKNAFTINGSNDVYFTGKITAQEVHTTYTTSSVLFQSGSSKFGDDANDKHEFTGSVKITGSFEVQGTGTDATIGDLWVDSPNKTVYVGRQSATSGNNSIFVVRNRINTVNALYVDAGGNGAVNVTGSFDVTRGVKLATATGTVSTPGNVLFGADGTNKHEITGSINSSFGGFGGIDIKDGFEKTFTAVTGNIFNVNMGTAEGGAFVDVTYGGVVTSINGYGGATRYALSYVNATNVVATKVSGYGSDIISASVYDTSKVIFSIAGHATNAAKYQINTSVNGVATDGSGNFVKITYERM